jgi:prepilin-type processing-associated H-X9-DG protein
MELLVMMGVIAVLSSLLFPTFIKVKEKAKQTVCAYNERQLGLALAQYVQDNDEALPAATDWAYGLYPYVQQPRMFLCPDYAGNKKIAYAMNSFLDTTPLNGIALPSNVVAIFETAASSWQNPDPATLGDDDPNGIWVGFDADINGYGSLYRHTPTETVDKSKGPVDPGLNYIFADGHVKFLPYSHIEDLTAANNGLTASAKYPIGTFKDGATVTFNYLAPQ